MQQKKNFYITTPLYYPSSNLHIGHSYTTVLADIFARYKKENNYNVFFLVGSDEHGQKIETKAKEANLEPIAFVNNIVANFKELWKKLDINYNHFERTTSHNHKKLCQDIFSKLLAKKLIYKDFYSGLYCKSCEEFVTSSQVTNNICNISKTKVEKFSEESYFFKVSNFSKFLLELLQSKDFLFPEERRKEMINNFIKPGLTDLSVTRTSFDWGIKINEDKKHILYVWLDALSGYLSGIKYQQDNKFFEKFWGKDTEIIQLIGKEITRFHSIYWPSMLKALDLRMPNKLLSHGWIIINDEKMSKSIGNVVDPLKLIFEYGKDALRFFLAAALKIESDNNYTEEIFKTFYNKHLVNNYGNLVSRVSKMILKYFDGKLINNNINLSNDLIKLCNETIINFKKDMNNYNLYNASKIVINLFAQANKYVEQNEPWKLFNKNNDKLQDILFNASTVIIVGTYLLKPILVSKSKEVFTIFNLNIDKINYDNILDFNSFKNIKINKADILFKRKQ